jgi:hypothetical protein
MLQLFRAESNGASWVEEAVVQEHAGHPCKHHTCHNNRQQLHHISFGYNKRHRHQKQNVSFSIPISGEYGAATNREQCLR